MKNEKKTYKKEKAKLNTMLFHFLSEMLDILLDITSKPFAIELKGVTLISKETLYFIKFWVTVT